MAIRLGMDAKLYFKTGGISSAGTWSELGNTKDVTLNLETGEADVTTRANQGWRATVATLKDGSVEWEMVWDTEDAGFTAVQTAYFTNTALALAVMDGDITTPGNQGLQADFSITNFSRSEPLEEAISVSVTAKPTYSDTAPEWVTIPPP